MTTQRARMLLILLPAVLCVACPARWHFVFINASDKVLEIAFSDNKERYAVPGGARKSVLYPLAHSEQAFDTRRLVVSDPDGTQLYDVSATNLFWRAKRDGAQYPDIYILLTTNAAYTVPPAFRDTWKAHLEEIKASQ